MMAKFGPPERMTSNMRSGIISSMIVGLLLISLMSDQVKAGRDKGDDIILSKGKIIMRGGKGKGNIIVDPGQSGGDGGHSMISLMGHFNPYAFYPMQSHHQPPQHHQPMMIHPIYIEDHSAMKHQQDSYHQPEHHEQHQYQHEEPQHQYEHQEMGHQEQHYEPQNHYEQEGGEHHEGGGEEEQAHHHGGYEHHQHPIMAMMMHGSGPQPAYQQMSALQAMQQNQELYARLPVEQQAGLYQQAQMAVEQQHQPAGSQVQAGNEVAQSNSSEGSAKPQNKAIALLEKTAANSPLAKIIRPLFKRNKDQTEKQQKKP